LAQRLGGEEGLEEPALRFRVHAHTRVRNAEHDVASRGNDTVPGLKASFEIGVAGGDGKRSAVGHGVAGVDQEVYESLLELMGIHAGVAQSRIEKRLEFDVLADQAAEQL